jgi:hypothetical protein
VGSCIPIIDIATLVVQGVVDIMILRAECAQRTAAVRIVWEFPNFWRQTKFENS